MNANKLLQSGVVAVFLTACASPREVLENPVSATFMSTKSAALLASCIDKNTDGIALNSLRTNIKNTGLEPIEIVVTNGNFVHSIVQIKSDKGGSVADVRFGGVAMAQQSIFKRMTSGCE